MIGEIDIDLDRPHAFDSADRAFPEEVAPYSRRRCRAAVKQSPRAASFHPAALSVRANRLRPSVGQPSGLRRAPARRRTSGAD